MSMTLDEMKALPADKQEELFKEIHQSRRAGKSGNYASVYGAGGPTIAKAAGVDLTTGDKLFEGYWKLQWSVKVIADEQYVFEDSRNKKWLVNPVNGFCYSLRKDADRFSTLAQGTGSYIFDLWVDKVETLMEDRHGVKRLIYSAHDEFATRVKDRPKAKESIESITQEALEMVNIDLKLRREMGCDVQFGKRYSDIH